MKETGYRIRNPYYTHFLTFTVVGWVDIFSRLQCREILIRNFKYCMEHNGMLLYGFVILSNHVHVIMAADESTNGLSWLIRDFKSYTSKQLMSWILSSNKESRKDWMAEVFRYYGLSSGKGNLFQIWTHENCPMVITQPVFFNQKLNYIHQNPVRAGIVRRPEDYIYSSASNYAGMDENILDVIVAELWLF